MNTKSEYHQYTQEPSIQARAEKEAARFASEETQFQLGHLPTEQPHPYTRNFSHEVKKNPALGCARLLQVDNDLVPVARRVLLSPQYFKLVEDLNTAIRNNKRVCFSGCGSTGRLAMMLEEMWRQYWEDRAGAAPGDGARSTENKNELLLKADLACSIMTGGDRALIRSVENFEDYEGFGARQTSDLNLGKGDVMIAISEGGETSSVIGTAEEALRRGCRVSFVFNNPSRILTDTVERSRRLIENPQVNVLDLFSGPMALTGSTRMQATSLEMFVVGTAIEEALISDQGVETSGQDRLDKANGFASLISELGSEDNLQQMGRLAAKEAAIYEAGGRITYLASRFLLDIFSDTTERSPTFMLPPFRPVDDHESPVSWAYAKDHSLPGNEAWFAMLRRSPRGIDWTSEDYSQIKAPLNLIENPPDLGAAEISRYLIGMEEDPSRTEVTPNWFLRILIDNTEDISSKDESTLLIGASLPEGACSSKNNFNVTISLPESPVLLWHHLAVKLVMNTISTASMGIMGRIRGNWMVQLDPTNKKLVDRGSRIISHLSGLPYSTACIELHKSIYAREAFRALGYNTTTSPIVDALNRLDCN